LAIPLARPCIADGALAIGIPPGGAKNGLASGVALDRPDPQTARQAAIDSCHKSTTDSDEASKKACKVVETFKDKCYAIALDPEVRGGPAGPSQKPPIWQRHSRYSNAATRPARSVRSSALLLEKIAVATAQPSS